MEHYTDVDTIIYLQMTLILKALLKIDKQLIMTPLIRGLSAISRYIGITTLDCEISDSATNLIAT